MKNNHRFLALIFILGNLLIISSQCRKAENIAPEIITADVSKVTASTATGGGIVSSSGSSSITARGVCWNTYPEPTIVDGRTNDGTGTGHFISNIYGLSPDQTYYLRAYATNAEGTSYGNEVSITTGPPDTLAYDPDGNIYHFLKIGTQIWMAENLKTTKYADGSPIATTTPTSLDISLETAPSYQWSPNRDASNVPDYGRIYTGFTVESNMLCPAGWRVPTDIDWKLLSDYLGGINVAGGKLKESGTAHWASPNMDATNETGFSARGGGGGRDSLGNFDPPGQFVIYWSSTRGENGLWNRSLSSSDSNLRRTSSSEKMGFFVRCIKN
jgi:uncharacterized protein (TIGR02145 family)